MFSNKNYEFIDNFPSDFVLIHKVNLFNDWEIPPSNPTDSNVDNMLQKYPKNRLNATEVIKLFNEVEEYRKKKYWLINAFH